MCRIHTKARPRPLTSLGAPLAPVASSSSSSSSSASSSASTSVYLPSTLPLPSLCKLELEDDPVEFSDFGGDLYDAFMPAFHLVLPPGHGNGTASAIPGAVATSSLVTPMALEEEVLDFNFPSVASPASQATERSTSSDYEVPSLPFGRFQAATATTPAAPAPCSVAAPEFHEDSEDHYSHSSGIEMEDEILSSPPMMLPVATEKAAASVQPPKKKRRIVSQHPPPTTEEKRERNRLAAEKYRQKGRDTIAQLTDKCQELSTEKQALLNRNKALENEVSRLRNIILKAGLAL